MIKDVKPSRKIKLFCDHRLYPILLLWGCTVLACRALILAMGYLTEGEHVRVHLVDLSTFGDARVVVLLSLSVLIVMAISFIIKSNVHKSSLNQAKMEVMTRRLWDEVSSAATHAGSALFVSLYWVDVAQLPLAEVATRMLIALILALVGLAYFDAENLNSTHAESPLTR